MLEDNIHLSQITMTKNQGKGETVEVRRRSLVGKDTRSKICTSKGSRDRRIRLSANTAIQFYDVQDRLGFDRPSNAIDWLMKEAKAAIDVLNDLNDDHYHYHHHQGLLVSDTATNSIYSLSDAFHRTPCVQNLNLNQSQNMNQINGFDKYPFEIMDSRTRCESQYGDSIHVVQDPGVLSSAIRRRLSWNPNYNEAQGFEFVNTEPRESNLHPPIVHTDALKNESYGFLGVSFEGDDQVQEKEDDRSYGLVGFETNCC